MAEIMVSVTVITYMHEKYIRQALDSVFMQKTNFDFEVIVAEDASPDNTRAILLEYKEKYGDKLKLILQEKNVGPSKNSECARKIANGKYIAGLEGDDFWTDEYKLQKQFDILENNPQYVAVGHDCSAVAPDGSLLKESHMLLKKDSVKTMKHWQKEGFTVHGNTLLRRNIFPENDPKYIAMRTSVPTMGDLVTFTMLYDAGDIYVMKDTMLAHRVAGDEDKSSFAYAQRTKSIEYTNMFIKRMRGLEEYFEHKYDFSPRINNRIASVKLNKILGKCDYSSKEMKEIMKTLSLKNRAAVYMRVANKIIIGLIKKVKRIYGKK